MLSGYDLIFSVFLKEIAVRCKSFVQISLCCLLVVDCAAVATAAVAKVYGKAIVYSGPIYKSMTTEGNKIRLQFDYVGDGLITSDGKSLVDFTIAGVNQNFVPAVATIDGNSIVVSSNQVAKPVAVRYAWHDGTQPNLANKEGLPASPFRTDTWKGVTEP